MKQECIRILKKLTGKNNIYFTKSGNKAILAVLKILKSSGFRRIMIPDQAGWLTYYQYPKRMKLKLEEYGTNFGIIKKINFEKLIDNIKEKTIIIINSMPAYAYFNDMPEIKNRNIKIINDAAGSIATEYAKYGDFVVGSFGKWKPVEIGSGGFIAADENLDIADEEIDFSELLAELKSLNKKTSFFENKNRQIKKDLEKLNTKVINSEKTGYNVIIHFDNDIEKEKIIKYCNEKKLEFTLCPRYIRVNDSAVCIEVKRLKGDD